MSEAKVSKGALPSRYSFVPKGNVYITSNCRKLTQERGCSVFIVVDTKKQQIGIGVPTEVYVGVQFKERDTRADRAANVIKRDEGIAKGFESEIMKEFSQIPPNSLRNVLKIALEKGKGKVGRTGKLDVQRKVHLAVRAHIRHCETDYDMLLRTGVAREDARKQIEARIQDVCKAWGGSLQTTRVKPAKTLKPSSVRPNSKVLQATQQVKRDSTRQPTKDKEVSSLTAADSVDFILREATRRAMRAHREKGGMAKVDTTKTKPQKQQIPSPDTSSPKVVATAASFRERRTPKLRVTQPITPSPSRVNERWANPNMPNLEHENRAQILRLIARIDRLEHSLTMRRKKKDRRRVTRLTTIVSLHGQINGILADAAIQMIETSAAARRDLVRRLRRTVRVPKEEPA